MARVYLDHNATSPMRESAKSALLAALEICRGNPGSPHAEGQSARLALEVARGKVARALGARPSEVVFTSGATESNNAAIRGIVAVDRAAGRRIARVVTSAVEHPSILETCRSLAAEGVEVTILPVDRNGIVDPARLAVSLEGRGASVVSIMHANNETGVVQSVQEMARIARGHDVPFHTDIAQSAGRIPIEEAASGADLISVSSHKVGGPVGIGALIVREGTPFRPSMTGGAQEGSRRAGTEPATLAASFAEALEESVVEASALALRTRSLRDIIEAELPALDPAFRLHGGEAPRLPNTLNFHLPGSPGRILVMKLDLLGYAVSTGSACSTGASRPSHVLEAMGCPAAEAIDSIRVSLGRETTRDEILGFLEALRRSATGPLGEPRAVLAAPGGRR